MHKKLASFITLLLLTNCSQKPAQILFYGDYVYAKNGKHRSGQKITSDKSSKNTKNPSRITIEAGDNVYLIARHYNVSSRDIINLNNLKPPYTLKVGQTLKLPKIRYHKVKEGENLHLISQKRGVSVSSLVEMNALSKPYMIRPGDKLILPGQSHKKSNNKPTLITEDKQKAKNTNFIWPVNGIVISKFGPKGNGLRNDGINIKASTGTDIKSVEAGRVAYVGDELEGYGNLIIIKHANNWISAYAHAQRAIVKRGEKVSQGQIIGYVGQTGNVTYPQLYFGLRKGRKAVDPQKYL